MKKNFLKILVFLLIFMLLDLGISVVLKRGYKKINYEIIGKLNKLYYGNVNEEVIILGDSRAIEHFNPIVLEKVYKKLTYNFGIAATPVREHYFIISTIINRGFHPSKVIYNIGINTFGKEGKKPAGFHYYDHQPYYSENKLLKKIIIGQEYNYFIKTLCKCYAYNRVFLDIIRSNFKKTHLKDNWVKGADIIDAPWDGKFEEFIKDHPNGYTCHIDEDSKRYFLKLIKLTRLNNIELILVMSPEYYEIYKYQNNRKEVLSFIKNIAKENNIVFLDYGSEKCYLSKCRRYFFNSQHLNKKGANIFSKIVALDLYKIWNKSMR